MYIEAAMPAPGGHVILKVRSCSVKREHATQPLFADHLNDDPTGSRAGVEVDQHDLLPGPKL